MSKYSMYRKRGTSAPNNILSGYLSRVQAVGGTVSTATLLALDTLVLALQAGGVWDRCYDVWPCAGDQLAAGLVKLKVAPGSPGAYTNVNFVGGDYVEAGGSGGLTGDGATKSLAGGAEGGLLGGDSHLSASVLAVTPAAGNRAYCGVLVGAAQWFLGGLNGTASTDGRIGSATTATDAAAMNAAQSWLTTRASTTDLRLYRDGVQLNQAVGASVAGATAYQIMLFAYSSAGVPAAWCPCRLAGHTSGLSLNATQAAALAAAWTTFNSSLGR